ncbi:unnamed protein product [Eruca vesicaria subsp. sativa]|uniref:Uncharacterized protein n=1 Tax=Eruca vesicaria subsp. sativa TaxID=29727 RepID=A0ABC8M1U1_ERUVS|nr:unnamed protein product [Eruca vesicaria subsp. sativa]
MIIGSSRKMMIARLFPQDFDTEHATGGLSDVLGDLNVRVFSQDNVPLLGEGPLSFASFGSSVVGGGYGLSQVGSQGAVPSVI